MAGFGSRSRHRELNAWPGWVDALSSLVMVVMFLLMVFVVGQVFTAATLSRRDEQLTEVTGKVAELNGMLATERKTVADLRATSTQLSDQLRAALAARTDAETALTQTRDERDAVAVRLRDLEATAAVDREKLELRLREIASLQADFAALRDVREKLEGDVAALARLREELQTRLQAAESAGAAEAERRRLTDEEKRALLAELGALRDRSQSLTTELADAREKTMLAQKTVQERDVRLAELLAAVAAADKALDGEKRGAAQARRDVETLAGQIAALRDQLARLAATLDASEKKAEEQRVQIVDLGARLNQALAGKVQELARYRSEFFGRVREALGNRPDVRIVGDRFVFQSELLFASGSAALESAGRERLAALARTMLDIARTMPADINWVLRVDGHTDVRPIATREFPSNWELSAARAISVVKFLIEQGIPAERLAAAGFGEHQPLDPARSEEALSRNRRIELKLDQR